MKWLFIIILNVHIEIPAVKVVSFMWSTVLFISWKLGWEDGIAVPCRLPTPGPFERVF